MDTIHHTRESCTGKNKFDKKYASLVGELKWMDIHNIQNS